MMIDQITVRADSPDEFEFLIGYIEKFEFLSKDVKRIFEPHPIVGHVYQILKKDDYYIIHIGNANNNSNLKGIFLGGSLSERTENKWDYSIVVIDKENMLDYSLKSEDLQKIGYWLDTKHEDLRKELTSKKTPTVPQLLQSIMEINPDFAKVAEEGHSHYNEAVSYNDSMTLFSDNINYLSAKDPDLFESLKESVKYLASNNTSLAIRGLIIRAQSGESFVSSIVTCVEDYMKTKDPSLVNKLIELCFYEKNRLSYMVGKNTIDDKN